MDLDSGHVLVGGHSEMSLGVLRAQADALEFHAYVPHLMLHTMTQPAKRQIYSICPPRGSLTTQPRGQ